MSGIPQRLSALRREMKARGIDIYVIPTADYHGSEYVGEHFKARQFITGFTGSAGTAVITLTEAGRTLQEKAKDIPGQVARCIDLPPEKAQTLYALLYELLGNQKNDSNKGTEGVAE